MRISVLTIFPDFFTGALTEGMVREAREKGVLEVNSVNLRDFTFDAHRTTDDYPFGGGVGMVMKVEPIDRALESLAIGTPGARPARTRVALFSPQGRRFDQACALEYAALEHIVLLCGRYKGIDERVRENLVDEELSIGDFILAGGEPAAMCVIDAVARLLPGVLGDDESSSDESFSHGLLEYPQWTRPSDFRGLKVPEVLLNGNHAEIEKWRREQAKSRTKEQRPDLLK